MKWLFIGLIRFYQLFISPMTPPTCRFYPSCSQYALEAFRRFGIFKGSWLTMVRLAKCNPFHSGGIDYVPARKHHSQHE